MIFPNLIADDFVRWEPYAKEDILCKRFSPDEWHMIVADIHSDEELQETANSEVEEESKETPKIRRIK